MSCLVNYYGSNSCSNWFFWVEVEITTPWISTSFISNGNEWGKIVRKGDWELFIKIADMCICLLTLQSCFWKFTFNRYDECVGDVLWKRFYGDSKQLEATQHLSMRKWLNKLLYHLCREPLYCYGKEDLYIRYGKIFKICC